MPMLLNPAPADSRSRYQRNKDSVPAAVLDISNWDDSKGAFVLPEAELVMGKRVVVVTCIMAAKVRHCVLLDG